MPGMTEPLNVIALISGGKDSFFSLLHCRQNGHKVVALANLYPAAEPPGSDSESGSNRALENKDDEHDLNSFMYQTVGHTVIPLYEQALGIPLYRQPIVGTAIQTGTSYGHSEVVSTEASASNVGSAGSPQLPLGQEEDETESLVPLLRRIMVDHPTANALSTGAILSTYQRTRIESVALRLGLTPLAYLWKYPILPPGTQSSLLEDMQAVGLEARIVKVASGGLDERFLWDSVANEDVIRRIESSLKRFGSYGDGAVLGEGGEFETLVVDGPLSLFKGRIEIEENGRRIIREGGGSSWLRILNAKVVMKDSIEETTTGCRTPDLLDPKFSNIFNGLTGATRNLGIATLDQLEASLSQSNNSQAPKLSTLSARHATFAHWTITANGTTSDLSIAEEAGTLIEEIRQRLHQSSLQPSDIISTNIVLRSMQDFACVNKVYGALFTKPNPPARVTIACGGLMPENMNIIIHLKVHNLSQSSQHRRALHVQSRSYWAPANIGPYSQAISTPLNSPNDEDPQNWAVSIAGQIPLIPHTMSLPVSKNSNAAPSTRGFGVSDFQLQVVLSMQHLWRVGQEMNVQWWTSAVAYLPKDILENIEEKAAILTQAWALIHRRGVSDDDSEDEEVRDLWEEKHYAGMEFRGAEKVEKLLPDWDIVNIGAEEGLVIPPFWVVEVEELPRASAVEWHAQLGVAGGPVKLYSRHSGSGWSIHQCSFGDTVQSVVTIDYSQSVSELQRKLKQVWKFFGSDLEAMEWVSTSYLDVSIQGMWNAENFGGKIPCRSMWDASGKRLAAVLILDTS